MRIELEIDAYDFSFTGGAVELSEKDKRDISERLGIAVQDAIRWRIQQKVAKSRVLDKAITRVINEFADQETKRIAEGLGFDVRIDSVGQTARKGAGDD